MTVLLNTRRPFSGRRGRSSPQSALRLTAEQARGLGREPGRSSESLGPSPSRGDPAHLPSRPNPSQRARGCAVGAWTRVPACPHPASLLLNLQSSAPGRAVGPGPLGCLLPHQSKTQPHPSPPPTQALLRAPPTHRRAVLTVTRTTVKADSLDYGPASRHLHLSCSGGLIKASLRLLP